MKSVLISIQPKWCDLIASGKKTVEVRKTRPKIEAPFKVYIYMTKSYDTLFGNGKPKKLCVDGGKVIGEFVCDGIGEYTNYSLEEQKGHIKRRENLLHSAAMTLKDWRDYIGSYRSDKGYAWHISDLVIYDKPRELREFRVIDNESVQKCEHREQTYHAFTDTGYIKNGMYCRAKDDWCTKCKTKPLKRPPQSWCYVERGASNDLV